MAPRIGRAALGRQGRPRIGWRVGGAGGSVAAVVLALAGCQTAQPGSLTIWNRIPDALLVQAGDTAPVRVPPCTEVMVIPFPYERYRVTLGDGRFLGWPTVDREGMVVTVAGLWPRGQLAELPPCGRAPTEAGST